jgi:ferritin-like metal-binding protein YciE
VYVSRLEDIFAIADADIETYKNHTMAGTIGDAKDIINETIKGIAQRDIGLIFAGQKAEHYGMAAYGGLKQLATVPGYPQVASRLQQTLAEKKVDELLSSIAEKQCESKRAGRHGIPSKISAANLLPR